MAANADDARRRVLVIEDDADTAEALRVLLEFEGHTVEVASSGAAAVEVARTFRPDVTLCDLGLPGMDGLKVAHVIRADAALCATRLVAVTGYGHPADIERTMVAGFDAHLLKPPDIEELFRLVRG